MNKTDLGENLILSKKDLIKEFEVGYKSPQEFKIGIEYERLLINKKTYQSIPYYGEYGIYRLLRQIAFKDEWSYLTDFGQVIGLKKGETTITLEPGGQFEISLKPCNEIKEIEKEIEKIDRKIVPIAKSLNINFINYGISPLTTHRNIGLIPKKRYAIMAKRLPGDLLANMMRETAGIQACFDFENEQDAMQKLRLGLKLSPIMSALFSNSPIYNGKLSSYKSYRALSWLFTDNMRCGLVCKNLFKKDYDFTFSDYIDILLEIPILFIVRDNRTIEIKPQMTFNNFLKQGYQNFFATIEDFRLHASLYFPDVRLKQYIEIRNHDCQKGKLKYSIPAIYKGLMYSQTCLNDTLELLKDISYESFVFARENIPKYGLTGKIGRHNLKDITKEIIAIAHLGLKQSGKNEHRYLDPVIELLKQEKCPADLIIDNWNHKWDKKLSKLIQYISE